MRSAVFLDRDGVLNESIVVDGVPHPPASKDDLVLLPGVVEACSALRGSGLALLVVTNQPDIARGTSSIEVVDEINHELMRLTPLDEVIICPHDDADGCACRKPAPGMLLDGARKWNVDLGRSVMVGDRWRDIEAGQRAGCKTVFIDRNYPEKRPAAPDLTAGSLQEALPWILANTR